MSRRLQLSFDDLGMADERAVGQAREDMNRPRQIVEEPREVFLIGDLAELDNLAARRCGQIDGGGDVQTDVTEAI